MQKGLSEETKQSEKGCCRWALRADTGFSREQGLQEQLVTLPEGPNHFCLCLSISSGKVRGGVRLFSGLFPGK